MAHDLDKYHKPEQQERRSLWTEITKDLVEKEAIEKLGYDYEETEWFFYVMKYLEYVSLLAKLCNTFLRMGVAISFFIGRTNILAGRVLY